MPRYFMHIRTSSGERIEDDEGEELDGLEASRAEALATAADLLSKRFDHDWRGCSLEVADERGETQFVVPFSAAPQPRRL